MESSVETIGEALRRRRKELGLTQEQLAARLGTTQSYVAQIERAAHRAVRWTTVQDFARALDLEPFFVPRERVAPLRWLLETSPDEEAPPLTGGSWDD
jgi:transcriptional regulator with XRE-family HTH domain